MFLTAEVVERRRSRLKYVVLGGLAGLYVLVVALVTVFEGKLVFPAPAYFVPATPADAGMAFEDIHIPVDGKTAVHAWWISSLNPDARGGQLLPWQRRGVAAGSECGGKGIS